MDDLVEPNHQEPGSQQHPGHLLTYLESHAAPEAAAGPECLTHLWLL